MSAIDVIRSFAESREPDEALVQNGISYGDCRQLLRRMQTVNKLANSAAHLLSAFEKCGEDLPDIVDGSLFDDVRNNLRSVILSDVAENRYTETLTDFRSFVEVTSKLAETLASVQIWLLEKPGLHNPWQGAQELVEKIGDAISNYDSWIESHPWYQWL